MNKKFKIVSSIALAGMLLTGSLGMNKVNAVETIDVTTNPVAVYRKLVEGKTVVPFVLANKADKLTVKDITESEMFRGKVETVNGNVVSSLETEVGTGDKFTTTDGTEYTVIVYGDVDGDGKISSGDAYLVEQYRSGMIDLNDVQREAADIGENDGSVNSGDSYAIKAYRVDFIDDLITNLPPKEEVVEESNYTLSIKDASYINSVNAEGLTLSVKMNQTSDKDINLKLEAVDKDGNKVEQNVTVDAHTDFIEDFATLSSDEVKKLADGTITVNLYDKDNKVVATATFEKNTKVPGVANVTTKRTGTATATLSLEKLGTESNVTKIKYVIKPIESDGTVKDAPADVEALLKSSDLKELNVQNNKLTDAALDKELATNTAYKIYYVAENEYGSQSGLLNAVISKDGTDVKAEEAVKEVKAPNLTENEKDFTWTTTSGKNYVVTLYRDGVAVAEKTTAEGTENFIDGDTNYMNVPGKYKVSVVVQGDQTNGTTTNSKATESGEVTVTKLDAVKDLKFEKRDDGKVVLSWTTSYTKDDFDSYDVKIEKLNTETGKFEDSGITVTVNKTEGNDDKLITEVEVPSLNYNTIYRAKLVLNANANQLAVLKSDEAISDEFYIVNAPDMSSAKIGTTSVTFTLDPVNIPNKQVSYKVEVVKVNYTDPNYNADTTAPYTVINTKDVTIDKADTEVTIDGLDPDTDYVFRLVATVDGNEVKSESTAPYITTLPVIENLTVTDKENEATENSGKIYSNGSVLRINGEYYSQKDLNVVKNVISTALKPGDVITANSNDISIKLDGNASVDTDQTVRDFSNCDLKDTTIEIEGNSFAKTIKGTFDNLVVKGKDCRFDLSGVSTIDNESKVTLADGVIVTTVADKAYTIESGAEVRINDIRVKTDAEVSLETSTTDEGVKELKVNANTTANDIEFENLTDTDAQITFVGTPDNTSEQRGTVKITSKGGTVKVSSEGVNVSADLTVEVTKGTVEVTDASLTGDKTVTLSADENNSSTIKAVANTKAPVAMSDFELKDYTDKEITDEFSVKDQEKIIAIKEFINSFGLNGTGAKITVGENSDQVTITLPETEEGEGAHSVTVSNLK